MAKTLGYIVASIDNRQEVYPKHRETCFLIRGGEPAGVKASFWGERREAIVFDTPSEARRALVMWQRYFRGCKYTSGRPVAAEIVQRWCDSLQIHAVNMEGLVAPAQESLL